MRKFTKFTAFLAAVLVLTMGGVAMAAGSDTATFGVAASVDAACVVGTTGNMSFGSLAVLDSSTGKVVTTGNNDATATFYQACTNGTPDATLAFAGVAATDFAMTGAAVASPDTIAYTLFSDAARSTAITKATPALGSTFSGFAADGVDHQITVYGRIALASMVAKKVDTYSDTVTVTVSY
jgi:spore coat protein U-like protein